MFEISFAWFNSELGDHPHQPNDPLASVTQIGCGWCRDKRNGLTLWQFRHLGKGSEALCVLTGFLHATPNSTICYRVPWEAAPVIMPSRARAWAHWPGHRGHIVSWEDAGGGRSQWGAFEPSVLTLLCHPIHLPFPQFKFVGLLRLVGVQSQVSEGERRRTKGWVKQQEIVHQLQPLWITLTAYVSTVTANAHGSSLHERTHEWTLSWDLWIKKKICVIKGEGNAKCFCFHSN